MFINSVRIIILKDIPTIPDHIPVIKYIILMFLWLVEYIHLVIKNFFLLNLKFNYFFF